MASVFGIRPTKLEQKILDILKAKCMITLQDIRAQLERSEGAGASICQGRNLQHLLDRMVSMAMIVRTEDGYQGIES